MLNAFILLAACALLAVSLARTLLGVAFAALLKARR
jgi:hypothetical protein